MQVASLAAITSSPRGTLSSSLMAFCARLRRSSICSACSAKMRPAGVKAIFVPIRSNNDAFSSCSSRRPRAEISILALRPIAPAHYLHLVLHRLMVRLLIIDDDTELCALLKEFLHREGFFVFLEHDGAAGLERALGGRFDLIVLDVMLPTLDGFAVLKKLRAKSRVPVLMLTARGEDEDRIVGLEVGADDYLAKPFIPRELLARIKAILRRAQATATGRIEVNGVMIDPGTREVFCDQRRVDITTLEFDILEVLVRSAGQVVSRDALMESMYNRKEIGRASC